MFPERIEQPPLRRIRRGRVHVRPLQRDQVLVLGAFLVVGLVEVSAAVQRDGADSSGTCSTRVPPGAHDASRRKEDEERRASEIGAADARALGSSCSARSSDAMGADILGAHPSAPPPCASLHTVFNPWSGNLRVGAVVRARGARDRSRDRCRRRPAWLSPRSAPHPQPVRPEAPRAAQP
jgi:hypothetical protein